MCLSADWADRLIPSNCVVLCFGWCVWDRTSTGTFFVPCWPLPLRFSCVFVSWCCGAPPFRCCCSVLLVWLSSSLCPGGLGACGVARFLLVSPLPSPPLVSLVFSGPVNFLLVPPSGYLVVFATVRLSYLWHGVSWLSGSCLHSASWQQRLRPCVGLCPLHQFVGGVHVPLAPALRYSPSGDPQSPSDTAKAARARLLGLCCLLPLASALSLLAGLRLPSSPCALVFCLFWFARCGVRCPCWCLWLSLFGGFVSFCLRGLFVVWFGLFVLLCVVCLWLFSLVCFLPLLASPHVILDRYIRVFCFHLYY